MNLAEDLAGRLESAGLRFDRKRYHDALRGLEELTLMARVEGIAVALAAVLPKEPLEAWNVIRETLPPPLDPQGKVFNDGYWMLPLASYWATAHLDSPEVALDALGELTQRGTAEFAIRPFVERYPELLADRIRLWREDDSFHLRRLASEGTRPYLPWKGRLKVDREQALRFFETIRTLAWDPSPYVRRSVANHTRDWYRLDPEVPRRWLEEADLPRDVVKRATRRR